MKLDPPTLAVLWQKLISIAEEQARTLVRASFTSQSGEMQDIASAVFDARGNMLAEGVTGTIGVLAALLKGLKQVTREYPPEALAPGDVLIGNDPWVWSGHTFDLAIVRPVFRADRLLGFTATISHLTDIGGKGWATDTADIYEEGLRLPILKLIQRGRPDQDLLRILKLNVRTPDAVEGDILAQVAATEVGARRLLELVGQYDLPGLDELGAEICDRTEAATRDAIGTVPPGLYKDEVFVGGFGEPLRIATAITAQGDRLLVNYSGTSAQVARGINSTYNFTLAYTVFNLKSALCPDIPNNEGTYRPILVQAPEGCLLNAIPPAPLVSRHILSRPFSRVIMGALAQAVPDRIVGDPGGMSTVPSSIRGLDASRRRFMTMLSHSGAMGASASSDGWGPSGPLAIVPTEILENRAPVLILERGLVTDSGGPGKYRGGCGLSVSMRLEGDLPAEVGIAQVQDEFPARGRLAGLSGNLATAFINGSPLPGERVSFRLEPGDILTGETTGGGGFYPPEQRQPEKVLEDVVEGYVSLEKAREVYKVAIRPETVEIDWEETRSIRAASNPPG